jgi:hypothetical protein
MENKPWLLCYVLFKYKEPFDSKGSDHPCDKGGYDDPDDDGHALPVDSRQDEAGYQAVHQAVAYLDDDVQQNADLGWPVSHSVSCDD